MPIEPILFTDSQSAAEQLSGASPSSVNTLVDAAGTVRARPGIVAWSDFPTTLPVASAITQMVVFGDYLVYTTADGYMWAWLGAGLVVSLSDATAATQLQIYGGMRPMLQAFRERVIAVAGVDPQTWTGAGLCARLGGSPPYSMAVAGIATRVVLAPADVSGTIHWSGPGDSAHESYDALDYAEAEARPDKVISIADNTNELFVFGQSTTQLFTPDPVVGFSTGRALNIGLLVRDSLIRVDDNFALLDRERRILETDGRSFTDVGSVIGKTLKEIATVSDCWAFRATLDTFDIRTWMFPTHGRGYIYQKGPNRWSEWRAFTAASGGYTAPTITSCLSWPEKNLVLVGLSTGQIAKLDTTAHTDMGDVIKVEMTSGFLDNGAKARKHCQGAYFRFKRGNTAQTGAAPRVAISYRDDMGAWRGPIFRDLGLAGDYNPVIRLRSLGVYRQRQWKVEYDASSDFVFAGAEVEFSPLSN